MGCPGGGSFGTGEIPGFSWGFALQAGQPSPGFGEFLIAGWGDACKYTKPNTAGQPGVSRVLKKSRWERHGGNDAEEAMRAQRGAGMGKGTLPAEESKQRCLKGPTRFLLAVHSFVNGYFSANKFNIYFQQVAGRR